VITGSTAGGALTDTLTEKLTAANGDKLTVLCRETATPTGSTGVLHGVDRWTVIGGTGRFSDAAGSGTGKTCVYLHLAPLRQGIDWRHHSLGK
jgi:hypothetical protein